MEFKCNLRPKNGALKLIFKGIAVGCGSKCFQIDPTKGPNEFLGTLPENAKRELLDYLEGKNGKKAVVDHSRLTCIELLRYISN